MKNNPSFTRYASMKEDLRMAVFFFFIISIFLYVANLVVYLTTGALFGVEHSLLLAILLGIFSASFVISSVIGMRAYNSFTRLYYLLSSIWMGFFTYLFLASVFYGILFMLTGNLHAMIGRIFFLIAVLAGIYGIVHAQKIVVKNVNVSLPNLPKEWQGRRAIWISDVHLGQIYDHTFTQRIVDRANAIPHDIVFIGGDLFDGTQAPDLFRSVLPLEKFNAPLGIYFITGNHEEFGDSTKFIEVIRSVDIHTLIDEMIEVDGLQIIGVDYRTVSHKKDFKKTLSEIPFDRNKPSILLKHDPKDIEVAAHAGISFQISGHTHKAQMWPLGHIAKIIYREFVYGFHPFKKMQVYTSSGIGTWGPPDADRERL